VNQQPPIAPARRTWVTFKLNKKVEPGFYWVWLPATPDVYWCGTVEGGKEPIGTRRLIMENGKWGPIKEYGSYCFKLNPPSKPYGGENVISGVSRPEGLNTNIWISELGLPQYVELDLGQPKILDTIYLTFDTNLDRPHRHCSGVWPECVRDYAVFCDVEGSWMKMVEVTGNYLRHVKHSFKPLKTWKVRLEVRATNGVPEARVYEIRLYCEKGKFEQDSS